MGSTTVERPPEPQRRPADRSALAAPAPPLDLPRLALLLLTLALTVPVTSAHVLDLAGRRLDPASLAATAAAQVAIVALLLGRRRPARIALRPLRLLGLALTFGGTLALGLRLAWPSMLPVSTSV